MIFYVTLLSVLLTLITIGCEVPNGINEREKKILMDKIQELQCANLIFSLKLEMESKFRDLKSSLATKDDLKDLKADLKSEISSVKPEISSMVVDLKSEISSMKSEISFVKSGILFLNERLKPLIFIIYHIRFALFATIFGIPITQLWMHRDKMMNLLERLILFMKG